MIECEIYGCNCPAVYFYVIDEINMRSDDPLMAHCEGHADLPQPSASWAAISREEFEAFYVVLK